MYLNQFYIELRVVKRLYIKYNCIAYAFIISILYFMVYAVILTL